MIVKYRNTNVEGNILACSKIVKPIYYRSETTLLIKYKLKYCLLII